MIDVHESRHSELNERMVDEQLVARGIRDPRVIDAFRSTPRELFVPQQHRTSAYDDNPLPLENGQTISQPYVVALMTESLALRGGESVLEIGTGSGYQTAILARLAKRVFRAELEAPLAAGARIRLTDLGVTNVELATGDGVEIFRDRGPFDAILSAAAPEVLPDALIEQLASGGRCVIPVGSTDYQHLWLIERNDGHITRRRIAPVRFVPLRSRA